MRRAVPALARAGELPFVLTACFLLLSLRRNQFGFWEDEGINLIKAMLVSDGFPLYREVHSDQAPLFTWLLVPFHRLSGGDHATMAHVAIAFGALALTAAYAIARELGGRGAALSALAILTLLAPMQKFASSIVLPMPALALACWAVFCALQARGRDDTWWPAAASGSLLALAVCIKLSFSYFLPIVGLALAIEASSRRGRQLAIWGGAFIVVTVAVLSFADARAMLPQLFSDHLRGLEVFREHTRAARIRLLMAPGFPLLYASAGAMAVTLLARGQRRSWAMVLWLTVVGLWIGLHRPLWAHHLPELLVPLSILLGWGGAHLAREAGRLIRQRPLPAALGLLPASLLVAGLSLHVGSHDHWRRLLDNAPLGTLEQLAAEIRRTTTANDWVLPDRPILGYLAGRKVPPAVACISEKRIRTGALTDQALLAALDRHRPAVITITSARFLRYPGLQQRIADEYQADTVIVADSQFRRGEVELQLFRRTTVDGRQRALAGQREAHGAAGPHSVQTR